uniref:MalT-like TPR region domain-containing protein n=1 Tax=Guillardia theta TaxID=55529 RepID=A0A7S4LZY5_GUITH
MSSRWSSPESRLISCRQRRRASSLALRSQQDDAFAVLRSLADVGKLSALGEQNDSSGMVLKVRELIAAGEVEDAKSLLLDSFFSQQMNDEYLIEMCKSLEGVDQPINVDDVISFAKSSQLPVLVRIDGFVAVARVLGVGLGLSAEASEVLRLAEEEVKSVKEERSSELLRAKLASARSQLHMRQGNYLKAWETQSEVVRLMDEHASNSSELCVEVSVLASVARQKGEVYEAKLLSLRAINLLPPDQPLLAALVRGEYGSTLLALGDIDEAVVEKQAVLDIVVLAVGQESRAAAQALDELGVSLQAQGKYKEAEKHLRKALEIREKLQDSQDSEVVASYLNLGSCMIEMGNSSMGYQLRQKALEICRNSLPNDHYQTASALMSVGEAFLAKGELQEAQEHMEEAIEIWERALGSTSPYLASALSNLARVLAAKKEYQRALLLFQRSLSIKRQVYGQAHPSIATSLNHLAGIWEEGFNDRDEAFKLRKEALDMLQETLGLEHPKVAVHMNNMAILEAKRCLD